jgi:hypothetical protein
MPNSREVEKVLSQCATTINQIILRGMAARDNADPECKKTLEQLFRELEERRKRLSELGPIPLF